MGAFGLKWRSSTTRVAQIYKYYRPRWFSNRQLQGVVVITPDHVFGKNGQLNVHAMNNTISTASVLTMMVVETEHTTKERKSN